ncbi:MAG: AraC family transcriptional regulator [Opitutaceae bacterium]|jgi:AraC-like DNA-binding protein/mannose-6-phosphate isomerase-like protein (cupin superfamily)
MPRSTQSAPKIVHNPHLPKATLGYAPLMLDAAFPLDVVLEGEREDTPITQLQMHDALEIGFCLEGSGTFYVGTKILPFHKGDLTVITDREFHRCRSSPGTRSRWAWFFLQPPQLLVPHAVPALTWEPERFSGPHFRNVITSARYPRLASLMELLIAEAGRKDACVRANLRSLFVLILNELHREFPRRSGAAEPAINAGALARIAPALEHIAASFHESITIPGLARLCSMSVRNFQLQFTRFMGVSPQAHVLNSRLQAAAALLSDSSRPIGEIAFTCGFNTLSSFNRAFRAAHRQNPRDYRRGLAP